MVLYENSKNGFLYDVENNNIVNILKNTFKILHIPCGEAERLSWGNSLQFMKEVVASEKFDDDIIVYLEYQVFLTSKRVDFMIAGTNDLGKNNLVIVELKQWEKCERTTKNAIVKAYTGGNFKEVPHPSYQAKCYVDMLTSYASNIDSNNIGIYSCSYLHNYNSKYKEELICEMYKNITEFSPLFIKGEKDKLTDYLAEYVQHKQSIDILSVIEDSELIPSLQLQESINSMMNNNEVFNLIDEQKIVAEQVLKSVTSSLDSEGKTVIICEGGPGTGKSVVAIYILCKLILGSKAAKYVTHNGALKNVLVKNLRDGGRKLVDVSHMFAGDGSFQCSKNIRDNMYKCLIVDESHRITEHWSNSHDEPHIESIIRASQVSVFFIDENQCVTVNDFGTKKRIIETANKYKADIICGEGI